MGPRALLTAPAGLPFRWNFPPRRIFSRPKLDRAFDPTSGRGLVEGETTPSRCLVESINSALERGALEDEVELRFSAWLRRHGYLEEGAEGRPDDPWWLSAAREPSGIVSVEPKKSHGRFEVNASVRVGADDRAGRSQRVRDAARPPFAEAQLELIDEGQVRFTLRRPTRTTQRALLLHPLSLLRRLAWLVPPPRQHQIRAFGVLAPAARLRPKVVPAGRVAVQGAWFGARKFEPAAPVPYREAWAKLLARVYEVNGHSCPRCPGTLRPFGAVLPPQAAEWVRRNQFVPVESTGPPGRQQALPLAS